MRVKIEIDEEKFKWLLDLTPKARAKVIRYALEKISAEDIAEILSLPSPSPTSFVSDTEKNKEDNEANLEL